MKFLPLTLLAFATALRANDPTTDFALRNGDRVVFYGDSITQGGGYGRFVEEYTRTRFPAWDLRFYNAGVGGDTVRGGWAGETDQRLERDVIRFKPTVITIMLGMNDGKYVAVDPATVKAFTDGLRSIVHRLQAALPEARITLIQSSPYDDYSRAPGFQPGYNETLKRLAQSVADLAHERGLLLVDFGDEMAEGIARIDAKDRLLAHHLLPDRVHPSDAGQRWMGAILLRAWHASALVARVTIDAKAKTIDAAQTRVTALNITEDTVSWTEHDQSLPMPLNPDESYNELAENAGARFETLNREPLIVTGLASSDYELKIDGTSIGRFNAAALAKGVDLTAFNTPMRGQAYHALWAADDGANVQLSARQLWVASAKDSQLTDGARMLEKADEANQAARNETLQPKDHAFILARVP